MSKKPKVPLNREKLLKEARAEIAARLATTPATGAGTGTAKPVATDVAGSSVPPQPAAKRGKSGKSKAVIPSKPKTKEPPQANRSKKQGCLGAAAQILANAKSPMNCKDIVEAALTRGLWETSGKTPAATLYAAVVRDIAAKGKASRFRKTERGMFAAA